MKVSIGSAKSWTKNHQNGYPRFSFCFPNNKFVCYNFAKDVPISQKFSDYHITSLNFRDFKLNWDEVIKIRK